MDKVCIGISIANVRDIGSRSIVVLDEVGIHEAMLCLGVLGKGKCVSSHQINGDIKGTQEFALVLGELLLHHGEEVVEFGVIQPVQGIAIDMISKRVVSVALLTIADQRAENPKVGMIGGRLVETIKPTLAAGDLVSLHPIHVLVVIQQGGQLHGSEEHE